MALAEKRLHELTASTSGSSDQDATTLAIYSDKPPAKSGNGLSDENATKVVEEVYLRTLSRMPNSFELEKSTSAISMAENPYNGISDVLWVLINSKEFILNH